MNPIEHKISEAVSKLVTFSQCKLCDVKMDMPFMQKAHLNSKKHKANITLFREQIRESVTSNLENAKRPVNSNIPPEAKHCKACNREFGAELDLNNDNSTELHLRNLPPRVLNLSQQSILNSEHHQQTQKEDLEPDLISKNSEPKSPNCDHATKKTENAQLSIATKQGNSDDSENLKDKVFHELEKLVQKLYYSKEVPYNVGLNYLIKINKELDEIITTNNDDKKKQAFSIELDEAARSNNHFNQNGFNFTEFTEENAKPLLYPVNFEKPFHLIENVTNSLENNAKPTNSQIKPDALSDNNKNVEINKASKIKQKLKKPKEIKSISDLLEDIILRRQNCKDELELLNKIEVLLKQLENVNEGLLLENILKCLEGFNRELDEIDFKKLKDDEQIEIKNSYCVENFKAKEIEKKKC